VVGIDGWNEEGSKMHFYFILMLQVILQISRQVSCEVQKHFHLMRLLDLKLMRTQLIVIGGLTCGLIFHTIEEIFIDERT
jgi:hypothetical protein